ncbi:hypothetical protein [Legionella sp. W05-934-2]|jgi:hypothetical protein|uniref:hypothetical protein n=1 Tax=Legionella sp. W05-934-2 TaxID=1198649 RepID=UPI0034629B6F
MSLSELLISLFLSTLLGSLLLQQYVSLSENTNRQLTLFKHQFEQTLLSKLITDSIHQAGFLPCGSQSTFDIWDASQSQWIKQQALITKPQQLIATYMDKNFQPLASDYSSMPVVAKAIGLSPNHAILLTNCRYSELNLIQSVKSMGSQYQIVLAYPSRFVIDEDSYIGLWHQDNFEFQHDTLFYGDQKRERITQALKEFNVISPSENIINITWQYKQLPSFDLSIWTANAKLNSRQQL